MIIQLDGAYIKLCLTVVYYYYCCFQCFIFLHALILFYR